MKIFKLITNQKLPITIERAWDFLSDPKNLSVITPDYMNFKIIDDNIKKMYAGQIINYTVTPLFGFKISWTTEITHMKKLEFFVDEQRFGPYSFWHHKHFLKEIDGGVEMTDIIDYALPFSFLGRIAHPLIVKPKLDEIFNYRYKKLITIFGDFKI
tara:strand:+ start:252 stop:719 length:468 start_codon:yes stop_codon:yes gene_type:complete